MIKYIAGSKYNTNTARWVGALRSADGIEDRLYQNRAGKYFLHKKKGGRESIIAISYEDAREFSQNRMATDLYQKEFTAIPSQTDPPRHKISALISEDVYQVLSRYKASTGKPISKLIEEACQNAYLS